MPGLRHRLASVAVDITPLRLSREFRLLYAGTAVGQLGSTFTTVAVRPGAAGLPRYEAPTHDGADPVPAPAPAPPPTPIT